MPPEPVRVELRGAVALVVFDDPERRNAMTEAMGRALTKVMARLAADAAVRAVVLTGAGVAFSAGGDLAMIEDKSRAGRAEPGEAARARNQAFMRDFYRLFLSVRDLPCPSIAAIQGAAIGAGLAVALACDLRIAAREARLGLNFAKLGIHPGMGSSWTLPRLVGPAHAADLLVQRSQHRRRRGRADRTREPRRRARHRAADGARSRRGDRGVRADRGARIQARARPRARRRARRAARLRSGAAGHLLRKRGSGRGSSRDAREAAAALRGMLIAADRTACLKPGRVFVE